MTDVNFPEIDPYMLRVRFTVDVTRRMLNPKLSPNRPDELIIPKDSVGYVPYSVHPPGEIETIVEFYPPLPSMGDKRNWWVDSAWFVDINPVVSKWWVELYVLFGDEVSGEYERVTATVEAAHRFQAINEAVAQYEEERQRALRGSADLPTVIQWIEIDVHVEE